MPLPIRDGNQSLTTLSTLIVNSAHVPAHTVISLGSQAITDIAQAVSGVELGPNTLNALENISVTMGQVTITGGLTDTQLRASAVTISGTVTANVPLSPDTWANNQGIRVVGNGSDGALRIGGIDPNSGFQANLEEGGGIPVFAVNQSPIPIFGTVTANLSSANLNAVTIGVRGTVTVSQIQGYNHDEFGIGGPYNADVIPVGGDIFHAYSGALVVCPASKNGGVLGGSSSQGDTPLRVTGDNGDSVLVAGTVTVGSLPAISGTVTANAPYFDAFLDAQYSHSSPIFLDQFGDYSVVGTNNPLPISGTVTVGSSVTIGSLPAISGTVTVGASSVTFNSNVAKTPSGTWQPLYVENGSGYVGARVYPSEQTPFLATVTVGNSVTIGSLPAISGTVTANVGGIASGVTIPVRLFAEREGTAPTGEDTLVVCNSNGRLLVDATAAGTSVVNYDGEAFVRVKMTNASSVTIGSLPAISGTVTVGALPSGALTTRFGTPTTANTTFATSAVTNDSRKYLLIQNVTTGSNVITVGIGFTPTTTQGIQLTAGAGITFESSYIPTGAVYVLSSVTASNFTILEA